MLYHFENMQGKHPLRGVKTQPENPVSPENGFETGEQLEKSAFARLAQLKALYRQKLGIDSVSGGMG